MTDKLTDGTETAERQRLKRMQFPYLLELYLFQVLEYEFFITKLVFRQISPINIIWQAGEEGEPWLQNSKAIL
jgi:hypothetical protein